MNLLIINTADGGDLVFATPLIRALKVQLDDAHLSILTTSKGMRLLEANPYLDKIYSFDLHKNLRSELKKLSFDIIVDLDNTFKSFVFSVGLGKKFYRRPKHIIQQKLDVLLKRKHGRTNHIVNQYLDTVRALGIKNDGMRPDYFIPSKDEVPIQWLPQEFRKGYVVLCLDVDYPTRRLPEQRLIELCDKINKPVLLIGGKEDERVGDLISSFFQRHDSARAFEEGLVALNKKTIVYNACGKFNDHQKASIVKQSKAVVTFDNEFNAIASAFGKEVVSIWGNTVLDFGRYPYNTKFTVLENNRLHCRPCSRKGYDRCPLGHFRCMNDIVFDFYVG